MRDYLDRKSKLRFVFPIDGDCLNKYDGRLENGILYVYFKVKSESPVTLNGKETQYDGEYYIAELPLVKGKNKLIADNGRETKEICVFNMNDAIGHYRLSSDDNVIFLWDINKNADKYSSIFDNPYLAVYKKAHDLYGACVHLNIYYEMLPYHYSFANRREYFNLSMMTEKFKDEWKANSSWLKLNFHARGDQPDKPYEHTDYQTIYEDCKKVQQEIIRFAGEDTLSDETTIHWGECTEAGVRAVRDLGIRSLAGYFCLEAGKPLVSYFYPKDLVDYLDMRDFWYDRDIDMMYCRIDNVMNLYKTEEIEPLFDVLYEQKKRSGFLEIMIHEEYFYSDYTAYIPAFEDTVLTACKWAKEKGYKGAFLRDVQ